MPSELETALGDRTSTLYRHAVELIRTVIAECGGNVAKARTTVAQAMLEGTRQSQASDGSINWVISRLASEFLNDFGQKGAGDLGTAVLRTTEHQDGAYVGTEAGFAHYSSRAHGVREHLRKWFDERPGVEAASRTGSVRSTAAALKAHKYATDPHYVSNVVAFDRHLQGVWKDVAPEYVVQPRSGPHRQLLTVASPPAARQPIDGAAEAPTGRVKPPVLVAENRAAF